MEISKQEQLLLSVIGVLVLGIIYYQVLLQPQLAQNQVLKQEATELKQCYQDFQTTAATIEMKKQEQQRLALAVDGVTSRYYPSVEQAQIILDLNKLLSEHQVSGQIDFSQPVVAGVTTATTGELTAMASTLEQQIAMYQGSEAELVPDPETESATPGDQTAEQAPTVTLATTEQMQMTLAVEGKYENVQKLIAAIEKNPHRLIITNAEIKALAEGNVTANIQVELYAVPSLETQASTWGLTGTYGKDMPFSTLGSAYTQTLITADENKRDFIGIMKSAYSDLASFMLGKVGDDTKESYVVADQVGTIEASMRFGQLDGQYTYTYTVDQQSYPLKGQQQAFTPLSNYIIVDLVSESLIDTRDTTKLELKVENKTDKTVVIFIRGDDEKAPRIRIQGENETVVVVKQ